jgi:hypothetical protein
MGFLSAACRYHATHGKFPSIRSTSVSAVGASSVPSAAASDIARSNPMAVGMIQGNLKEPQFMTVLPERTAHRPVRSIVNAQNARIRPP